MKDISRRQFLKLGLFATAAGMMPMPVHSMMRESVAPERSLAFYNTHTGESIQTVYWTEGQYIPAALAEINTLLRDHRNNEVTEMSTGLLDLLHNLNNVIDARQPFHVISGYRSPATNVMLAARSDGVAKHSMHLEGKAIDIRVPGRELIVVRRAAMALQTGGVGYYPGSGFVHVDVGRVRQWQG
ncbi:MAG: DUF882 domain-containing protein [Gammaproteobacteria bacterium]|nr:DUF882 domain-containing protein [Gammaproteobacteria bacterium]